MQSITAGGENFCFSLSELDKVPVQGNADPCCAGVADGSRLREVHGGVEHVLEFVFIFWRHNNEVGDGPKERKVEETVMGGAVFPNDTGPIQHEHHGEVLQAHIMEDLVVSALQKC